MNAKTILALILVALGLAVIANSGINFTTPGESINFFGLRVETTVNHVIPPFLGVLAVAGGILLLLAKPRWVR